jgi:hypothetical protein
MKHLKKYEQLKEQEPKIGDFVICTDNGITNDKNFESYLNTNIGKIILIRDNDKDPYCVLYEDIPSNFKVYASIVHDKIRKLIKFNRDEIKYFSKNKEDLERIIIANKYNI